jgi:class 4 POU domain transcription factor
MESHLLSEQAQHNHHHNHHHHSQIPSELHPFYQHQYAAVAHHHAAAAAGVLPGMVVGMHHHAVHHHGVVSGLIPTHELDVDPRELESFAERFKQRRIKLGVTQADVGHQLSKLKMPGVGSLSQSTICRFESLTLSHNNMVALKPVLQAWLEFAEAEMRQRKKDEMNGSIGGSSGHGSSNGNLIDKKRKRTSIAAQEKRFLESCFIQQQRPSGERIAQIADKLDLKKNVVRVWFCNQRQKNKRLRFAAGQSG